MVMARILTESEKTAISEAIKNAESQSTGELVTVITKASDDYWFIPSLWAALVALLVPAVLILVDTWWNIDTVYTVQIGVFLGLVLLFRIPAFKFALVPKSTKHARASRVGREQFFMQDLQNTQGRTGILLFVSIAEHYVEVIADKGINDVVPAGTWDQVVSHFITRVKAGQYAEGFIDAINGCGDIMRNYFPATDINPDELPDHLVEL
jgi:putative membrane protein